MRTWQHHFAVQTHLPAKSQSSGLSLLELLAVLVVAAILLALLLPVLGRAIDSAKQVGCAANLRAISNGCALYAADYNGYNPPGIAYEGTSELKAVWTTLLVPYMGWTKGGGHKYLDASRYCPATSKDGTGIFKRDAAQWATDYAGNGCIFVTDKHYAHVKRADVAANVVLLFEGTRIWAESRPDDHPEALHQRHHGKGNVVFMDGHVECLGKLPGERARWGPELKPALK